MTKLFISYRSLDSAKVDTLVSRLRSLKVEEDTSLYAAWQDKDSIPAGQDWWESIVIGIEDCDVFVFMVSRESVTNINCRAELSYARRRNRPVIPVVLEGEFAHNPVSGKNDIDFWADMPQELNDLRAQFLFYEGTSFLRGLADAIEYFQREPQRWGDIPADRPPDPRHASDESNNAMVLYDQACDYAHRQEYQAAERWFQKLVNMGDPDFGEDAREWILLLREYQKIINFESRASTRHRVQPAWEAYAQQFPKPFINLFDPAHLTERIGAAPATLLSSPNEETGGVASTFPVESSTSSVFDKEPIEPEPPFQIGQLNSLIWRPESNVKPRRVEPSNVPKIDTIALMPGPFEWIEIPGKDYNIAKYPVTNEQFAEFINAGGYQVRKWWTEAGWKAREQGQYYNGMWRPSGIYWTQPLYWQDAKRIGTELPDVTVSWFEAVAFCLWLSDITGENIMLPTEDQWQYAAQGSDGRAHPWGNAWDCNRCNNSVKPCEHSVTTPVRHFESNGDSPFAVVDMAGNVWEWCLTDYDNKTNDVNSEAMGRVLRGGSRRRQNSDFFRCDFRSRGYPYDRDDDNGFRISRS